MAKAFGENMKQPKKLTRAEKKAQGLKPQSKYAAKQLTKNKASGIKQE